LPRRVVLGARALALAQDRWVHIHARRRPRSDDNVGGGECDVASSAADGPVLACRCVCGVFQEAPMTCRTAPPA